MDPLNGIFIELVADEEGTLHFSGGWEFDDDVSEEYVEYMQTLLAGLYGIVSTQVENVYQAGQMVRAAPGFDNFEGDQGDGFEFIPDEDLVRAVAEKEGTTEENVVQFDLAKFSVKNKRKH
jgi:hypothetical protein